MDAAPQRTTSRHRALRWLACLGGLAGVFFGFSGAMMAGSFTVSNPERLQHWLTMYLVYLGIAVVSAAGALAAVVALFRTRVPSNTG